MKYTIAVDFDGVIHSYSTPWKDHHIIPDQPVVGAIEWLNEIGKDFTVVIHTTRAKTELGMNAVSQYLTRHGCKIFCKITSDKPPALIYLDDRAVRFEGPGTFPTKDQIHKFRPWNKPLGS